MKKYFDYLEEINRIKGNLRPIEKAYDFHERWRERLSKAKTEEEREALKAERQKEIDATAKNEEFNHKTHMILAIMENNKKALLFECVMPYILQILKDYDGKPYGEKTREKMRERLRIETGCTFWISRENYSGDEIAFAMLDKKGCCYATDYVKVYAPYQKHILIDNRIHANFTADDFHTYDFKPFISDPVNLVIDIELARLEADRAREAYDKAIHNYNALLVSGMNELSTPNYHPHGILKGGC